MKIIAANGGKKAEGGVGAEIKLQMEVGAGLIYHHQSNKGDKKTAEQEVIEGRF